MKPNDIPENYKVIKPWGSEYTIYKNLITSTKLLNLEYNKSTSLHCHPLKKTGFILLETVLLKFVSLIISPLR